MEAATDFFNNQYSAKALSEMFEQYHRGRFSASMGISDVDTPETDMFQFFVTQPELDSGTYIRSLINLKNK